MVSLAWEEARQRRPRVCYARIAAPVQEGPANTTLSGSNFRG